VKLPVVELGSMVYKPGWSKALRFYIVVKRTLIKDKKGNDTWKYYGVVTNWNLFRANLQTIMEFHQKRGNSENFIKEQKWAYDLLHFPMQKLHANHAYGLLAMVAHNLLRTIALLDNRRRWKRSPQRGRQRVNPPWPAPVRRRASLLLDNSTDSNGGAFMLAGMIGWGWQGFEPTDSHCRFPDKRGGARKNTRRPRRGARLRDSPLHRQDVIAIESETLALAKTGGKANSVQNLAGNATH